MCLIGSGLRGLAVTDDAAATSAPSSPRLVGVSTQPEFTAASRIPAYSLPRPLEETTCSRGHLPFSCLNQARSQRPFLQWVRLGNRRPVGVPPASALGLRVPHQ